MKKVLPSGREFEFTGKLFTIDKCRGSDLDLKFKSLTFYGL
jgi:hypothetical protein